MPKDSLLTAAGPSEISVQTDRGLTTALLVAMTGEAQRALCDRPSVRIIVLPFRVGRETRLPAGASKITSLVERRFRKAPPLNDLYLMEPPSQVGFHISREHFAIDRVDSGLVLIDRGSACGTLVGDRAVGGDSKETQTALHDGDLIVVGTSDSPYVFQLRLSGEEVSR